MPSWPIRLDLESHLSPVCLADLVFNLSRQRYLACPNATQSTTSLLSSWGNLINSTGTGGLRAVLGRVLAVVWDFSCSFYVSKPTPPTFRQPPPPCSCSLKKKGETGEYKSSNLATLDKTDIQTSVPLCLLYSALSWFYLFCSLKAQCFALPECLCQISTF